MRACVRTHVRAYVRACVRVCFDLHCVASFVFDVCVCVCVCFDVHGVRQCLHFDFCCVFLFVFWRVVLWCIFHVG